MVKIRIDYLIEYNERKDMNILVVNNPQISSLPPARNLVEALLRLGHNVTLITKDDSGNGIGLHQNLKVIVVPEVKKGNPLKAFGMYLYRCNELRKLVDNEMQNNDILWTTTDKAVRDLKGTVLKYKHVMQLAELIKDIPIIPKQNMLKVHLETYARKAFKVVVPEYNRAHIQRAWWNLNNMPIVLPNKMMVSNYNELPNDVKSVVESLSREKRKIILYQGIFGLDRDLEIYAQALQSMQDEYAFYIMGSNGKGYDINNMLIKYPFVQLISHINPPYHLAVTKMAYIGLLPYKANRVAHLSVLNAVYCAPNKIYEYSAFGVPMIGTEVPGLTIPFQRYKCGYTVSGNSTIEIQNAINEISNNYMKIKSSCLDFYNDCNFDEIVSAILRN